MPVLLIGSDEQGRARSVRIVEDETVVDKLYTAYLAGEMAVRGSTFSARGDLNIVTFQTVRESFLDSPYLSDAQKQQALELYNSLPPGSRFQFVIEQPIIQQGGAVEKGGLVPIQVFVDP